MKKKKKMFKSVSHNISHDIPLVPPWPNDMNQYRYYSINNPEINTYVPLYKQSIRQVISIVRCQS